MIDGLLSPEVETRRAWIEAAREWDAAAVFVGGDAEDGRGVSWSGVSEIEGGRGISSGTSFSLTAKDELLSAYPLGKPPRESPTHPSSPAGPTGVSAGLSSGVSEGLSSGTSTGLPSTSAGSAAAPGPELSLLLFFPFFFFSASICKPPSAQSKHEPPARAKLVPHGKNQDR